VVYSRDAFFKSNLDAKYSRTERQMVPQMSKESENFMTRLNEKVLSIFSWQIVVMIVLAICFGTCVFYLWVMINELQLLSYFVLLNVRLPANLHYFMVSIFQVVNFEFVKIDALIERNYKSSTIDRFSSPFEQAGLNSTNFIEILGFDLLIFIIFIVVASLTIMFALMFRVINAWCFNEVTKSFKRVSALSWLFRFALETFLQLFMASMLNSYNLRYSTTGDIVNSIITFIAMVICLNMPLYVYWQSVATKREKLDSKQHARHYGNLYAKLNTKRGGALANTAFFFIRRIVVILTLVLLQKRPYA